MLNFKIPFYCLNVLENKGRGRLYFLKDWFIWNAEVQRYFICKWLWWPELGWSKSELGASFESSGPSLPPCFPRYTSWELVWKPNMMLALRWLLFTYLKDGVIKRVGEISHWLDHCPNCCMTETTHTFDLDICSTFKIFFFKISLKEWQGGGGWEDWEPSGPLPKCLLTAWSLKFPLGLPCGW